MSITDQVPHMNPLDIYRKYLKSGYTEEQANTAAEVLMKELSNFATKSDLQILMDSMNARFDSLEAKMDLKFQMVDIKFEAINTKLDALGSRLNGLSWVVGVLGTVFIVPFITLVIMPLVK